jgi:hypothetical protein
LDEYDAGEISCDVNLMNHLRCANERLILHSGRKCSMEKRVLLMTRAYLDFLGLRFWSLDPHHRFHPDSGGTKKMKIKSRLKMRIEHARSGK